MIYVENVRGLYKMNNKTLQKLVLKMPKKIVIVNKERGLTYEYNLKGHTSSGPLYSFQYNGKFGNELEGVKELYEDLTRYLGLGFELKK